SMQKSTLAAVMAVALSVPAVAIAGPKFEELERAVAPNVMDAGAIEAALVAALGTDLAAIAAVQAECGIKPQKKVVLGENTRSCITRHAETMARARKHAADDRAAIEAQLGTCTAGAGDCATARDAALAAAQAAAAERDALKLRLSTSGDEDGPPGPVDMTAFAERNCPPGFQGAWTASGQFTCNKPRWGVQLERPSADPSGAAYAGVLKVTAPAGREGLGQFPAAPPLPEPKGTCDGAGGKLLCYVLPIAAGTLAVLFIADAASDDFNLVTVER
ncbi:MAG: hypothetical protein Q8Q85_12545, partial [Gemmatimonadales bacterium]|nr:hypothetical protein [Gemmatimonadales bacterium]